MLRTEVLNLLGTRDWFLGKQFFHGGEVQGGWFQDDSSAVTFIMPPSDLITTATLKQTLDEASLAACCSPPAVLPGSWDA